MGRSPDDPAVMPRWIPRALALCVLAVFAGLLIAFAFRRLSGFIGLLVVALFVSFALEPAVNWLARRRWPRALATGAVMLLAVAAVVLFVAAMAPLVVAQVKHLVAAAPGWVDKLNPTLHRLFGFTISRQTISQQSASISGNVAAYGASLASNLLGIASSLVTGLVQLFTVALFSFYFIADGPRLRRAVCSLVKQEHQQKVLHTWEVAIAKTGGYLYSRLLLAIFSAVATYIVLLVLRVPYAVPLALWMGLVSQFIPNVGSYVGAAVPVLVTLLDSPAKALVLVVFLVAYQLLEMVVLGPRITDRTMQMHAAVAFGAVMVGGGLFGALGAFLALPGAAVLQAVVWSSLSKYDVLETDLTRQTGGANQGAGPTRRRWWGRAKKPGEQPG
jgi:predicted PurR-regulated permease PerM